MAKQEAPWDVEEEERRYETLATAATLDQEQEVRVLAMKRAEKARMQ
jgi:hypothetical protein